MSFNNSLYETESFTFKGCHKEALKLKVPQDKLKKCGDASLPSREQNLKRSDIKYVNDVKVDFLLSSQIICDVLEKC